MARGRQLKMAVYANGSLQGYIKAINYSTGKFQIIKTLTGAKNYNYDTGAYDIDYLTKVYGTTYGYVLV